MSMPPSAPTGYRPHLDALRAVAILFVLLDHLVPALDFSVRLAPVGVKLFFVLSGYLITGILLENRFKAAERGTPVAHVLRQFYIRRCLRIFPVYYLLLAVCLAFDLGRTREVWPWLATYTTNIFMGLTNEWPEPLSHAWSLAVEEQFYILWPLVMLWIPARWLWPAIVATIAFGSGFKVWAYLSGANVFVSWFSTPGSLDSLGAGALLALWQKGPALLGGRVGWGLRKLPSTAFAAQGWVPLAGIALVVLAEWPDSLNGTSPLVELPRIAGFSLLLLHASYGFRGLAGRIAGLRAVIFTGMLSYGLYLYHPVVDAFCEQAMDAWLGERTGNLPGFLLLRSALVVTMTFLAAWLSFRFFEKPLNSLKKFFPYLLEPAVSSSLPTPEKPPASGSYSPQLDGLRGIAILMVFIHHTGVHLPHFWDWGQMGVRLFFVLSGYLVTISLWKIEDRSAYLGVGYAGELGVFHLRRFARLLPAFLGALAFGVLAGMDEVIEPLLWHLTFLTNFKIALQGWFFAPVGHFWSLALQEQFYLVWPFFLLAVPRRWFPCVALGLVAVGYSYRVFCLSSGIPDLWRWVMLPGSIDTFALGGLLAWLRCGPGLPALPSRPVGMGLLLLAGIAIWFANRIVRFSTVNPWIDCTPEILEGLIAVILVWGCVKGFPGTLGSFLSLTPLRFLGKISYGIFVYHLILFYFFEPMLEAWHIGPVNRPWLWSGSLFAITLAVSVASWYLLEKPAVAASKRYIESLSRREK